MLFSGIRSYLAHALCFVFAISGSAVALAEETTKTEKITAIDPLAGENLFRVFGGLILVLVMAVALIWLLKKMQHMPTGAMGGIKLIGGLSIGQRERVVVVQLGDEQLLLGVTPGRVNTLHVLQSPLPSPANDDNDGVFSFPEKLKSVIEQGISK